ncbi:MAG: hypothetical protein LBH56_00535, partial [Coriobacteriales bacterium]|nr:hypothetical protein [Coriobacteriales bacterium]
MVRIPHLDKYPEVKSLVKQSGAFIDDARTLYGIINEFRIYSGILQSRLALPQQKILAIVIYKNLFPKDFALLQYGRGFLGSMLNSADHLKGIHETTIRKRIGEIDAEIKELKELLITELKVLDGAFVDIPPEGHRNNNSLGRSGFEYISSVQAGKEQNSSYQAISYEDIKKELRKKNGYARREQQIKGLSSDRISRLEKEKTEELERIEKSHSKSIAQILAEAPDCYDELVSHIEKEGEYKLDVCESIKSTRKEPLIRIFLE